MVYLENNRKYVKIRKNHKNRKRSRRIKKTVILSIIIAAVAAACIACLYFDLGSQAQKFADHVKGAFVSQEDKGSSVKSKASTTAADKDNSSNQQTTMQQIKETTITFTGDVLLSDYVLNNYNSVGIDGVIAPTLRQKLVDSDLLFINNEFPYAATGTAAAGKTYTFRVDSQYVTILNQMGVDIAGLANNHVLDYGPEALQETFHALDFAKIAYTGAGNSLEDASKLVTFDVQGKTYGFLAASRVIPTSSWDVRNAQPGVFTCYDEAQLIADITAAKQTCDDVFVSVHWGTEHTDILTNYQQKMAHEFVDAGADAVIGSHPHVLQSMEYYNGKPIFYSLGNFIFNQDIAQTTAVQIHVSADNTSSVTLLPATASNATTSEATAEQAASIYQYLNSISPTAHIDESGKVTQIVQ